VRRSAQKGAKPRNSWKSRYEYKFREVRCDEVFYFLYFFSKLLGCVCVCEGACVRERVGVCVCVACSAN
jgi:hypothetical protein